MTYRDKRGYQREHSNSVHRHRAYHHIYLKDRKKYPLPFEAYEVHHIDGNKNNNRMDNLAVLTPEEHDKAHELMELELEIFRNFGIPSLEIFDKNISVFMEKFGLTRRQVIQRYEDLRDERGEKISEGFDVYAQKEKKYEFLENLWKELMKLLKDEEEKRKKAEERKRKKKERNEKIKKKVKGFFKKK